MRTENEIVARRDAALALHRAGRMDAAESAYRAILATAPVDAETLQLLGVLLGQCGKLEEALVQLHRAIELTPAVARFQANLGTTLMELGRNNEALQAFEVACELEPDRADLHVDRGTALAALYRHSDAERAFREALQLNPAEFGAWINLGRALQTLGKRDEALHCFEEAIELEPESAVAHTNRGSVLAELGEPAGAIEAQRRAVACDPQFVEARLNLAGALLATGRPESAADAYREALLLAPEQADAHRGLAGVYHALGDYPQAIAALQRVLRIAPDDVDAMCNLGHLQQELGNFRAAEELYRHALQIKPASASAWTGLTETRAFPAGAPELTVMAGLLSSPDLDPDTRMRISFAYAKANDDAGDIDTAGSALIEANALARATIDYDVADDERRMQRIEMAFNASLLERWTRAGIPSERPIFILGMPRSGTTLVDQMLASHPSVHGPGELPDFQRLVLEMLPGGYPQQLPGLDPERLTRMGHDYLQVLDRLSHDATRVADKLPANFFYVGLIAAVFPRAAILHCERDALDTCWSCFRKPFAGSQPWSYDLTEIARYYRAYRRLMEHWQRLLPDQIHSVRYEHLVSNPEQELRAVLEHCDLPWHPDCLQFFRNPRPVRTASAAQVRQPLYSSSIGASRRYGDLLAPLVTELGDLLEAAVSASPSSSPPVRR